MEPGNTFRSDRSASDVDQLRRKLNGNVVIPGDPGYDEARKVWNGALKDNPGNELLLATLKKFSP